MRIVALSHEYLPNWCAGSETMLHRLLAGLAGAGHEVEVWLPPDASPKPARVDGVRIRRGLAKADPARRISQWADVVVANAHQELVRAKLLARRAEIPVVALMHNEMDPTRGHVREYGLPQLVVFNAEWLAQAVGLPGVVVRPTVDPSAYATTPGDRITLVNLFEIKGPEVFWGLAKALPQRRFLGVKGAYGEQDVRRRGNVEVIEHVPHQRFRDAVLARTKVLIMPSVYESWGRVGTEALSAGIPVVASDLPGLRESLGNAGVFVTDRTDVGQWARAVTATLEPRRWAALSQRAKHRAGELAAADDVARFVAAVEKLTRKGAGQRGSPVRVRG